MYRFEANVLRAPFKTSYGHNFQILIVNWLWNPIYLFCLLSYAFTLLWDPTLALHHRIMEFWFRWVKSPDQGVVFRWVRSADHGISVSEITGSWKFREWDHRITGFGEVDHEIVRIKTTRSWKIRDHDHGIIYFDDPAKMDHKIIKKLWSYDLGPWSMGLKLWIY